MRNFHSLILTLKVVKNCYNSSQICVNVILLLIHGGNFEIIVIHISIM